jgi:glutaredoxin
MQIQNLPILNNPLATDFDITIDSQDSNLTKRTEIRKKVKAGLSDPSITADDINQGAVKKLMTVAEQNKLAGIETGAEVNLLERVNGQTGS